MTAPSETTFSPPTVYLAALQPYPPNVASAATTYEDAHATWRTAYADLAAAEASIEPAKARDAQALRDAVAADKTPPGNKHEAAAATAVAVANERARVARVAADDASEVLKAAVAASTAELLALTVASIRDAADAYDAEIDECKRRMDHAAQALRDAFGGIAMIRRGVQTDYGTTIGDIPLLDPPTWPANPTIGPRLSVDRLEQLLLARPARVG